MKQTIEYVEPTHDYIYVTPVNQETRAGRIITPDVEGGPTKISIRALVIAVGPGVVQENGQRKKPSCDVGDIINIMGDGKPSVVGGRLLLRIQDYMVCGIIKTREETDDEQAAREKTEEVTQPRLILTEAAS